MGLVRIIDPVKSDATNTIWTDGCQMRTRRCRNRFVTNKIVTGFEATLNCSVRRIILGS